jgi:fused signal recognition particle receptor
MAGFFKSLFNKITNRAEIDWDDLEADLISSDLGVRMTTSILDELRELGRQISADDVVDATRRHLLKRLPLDEPAPAPRADGKPFVILVVGVNGTGKTTSSAKLGLWLKNRGHSVMLAAADTFRAAAVEQLKVWGERLAIPVISGKPDADAAGLAFTAMEQARASGRDVLLVDTAGRLQNKAGLMDELAKVRRVLGKQAPGAPHDTLLVLDATTGQNALNQIEIFREVAGVTGLVMTKLDGTARGGVLVAAAEKFGLPIHAIGVGEKLGDLRPFDARAFATALTGAQP